MKVTINGKEETFAEQMTLNDIVQLRKLNPKVIVLEYNGEITSQDDWNSIILKEEDVLEIVSFVGGG